MKVRLTEDVVKGLDYANGKEYRVADTEQTGFYVRVTSDARTFVAQASVDGKTKGPKSIGRFEDGMPVAEARRLAALQIAAWRTGANVQMPAPGVATLRAAFDEHLALPGRKGDRKVTRAPRTVDSYKATLEAYTPADWWEKPLSFINREMVNQRHTYIGDNHGQTSADLWFRYMRAVYRGFDRRHPDLNLPKCPCDGIELYKRPARETVITWEQLPGVWTVIESLSPIRRDCWKLLLLTGLRSNAGSQLKWKEIDLAKGIVKIPAERMKSGKAFEFPLSKYVVEMLKQRKADNARDFGQSDEGYVFPRVSRETGNVEPIADISEQGYDGTGNKIRVLPSAQVFRRTFNSVGMESGIPEHHRFFFVNHALPKRNVNEKHYGGMMGLEPYRASLEVVTARILKAVDVDYAGPVDPRDAEIARMKAELEQLKRGRAA